MWRLTFLYLFASVASAPHEPFDIVSTAFTMHMAQLKNGLSYNFHYVNEKDTLRESCSRYGSPESYNNYKKARDFSMDLMLQINSQELRMSHIFGEESFDKGRAMCRNRPSLNNCLANLTRAIAACVEPDHRARADTLIKAGVAVLDYVCHNERERVTTFNREGGQDCVNNQGEGVERCFTLYTYDPTKDNGSNSQVVVRQSEAEECREARDLQNCIVGQLKRCPKPAPANIIDGMFNSIINITPCAKYKNN